MDKSLHNAQRRIKVAAVTFEPRVSGLGKRIGLVAKELKYFGYDVCVFLPNRAGDLGEWLTRTDVAYRKLSIQPIPRLRSPLRIVRWLAGLPAEVLGLRRAFRAADVEIIHVNGSFFIGPVIAAKSLKLPVVWHLNDTIIPARVAPAVGWIVKTLADQIVLAAKAVGAHYDIEQAPNVNVIYAPVKTDGPQRMPGPRKQVHIGLVGNISPVKGIEYFIVAARLVKAEFGRSVRFSIAGNRLETQIHYAEGIERQIIDLGLSKQFELLGFIEQVDRYIASLDVLVLSSRSEACPMSVLEAMAAGVPVVAVNVGGVRELLSEDHIAGIVVPPADGAAIAEAVKEIIRDPEKAERLGQMGRLNAMRKFSLDECVSRHVSAYRQIVKDRKVAQNQSKKKRKRP